MPSTALAPWRQPIAILSTVLAIYLGYRGFGRLEGRRKDRTLEPSPTNPVLMDHFRFIKVNGKKLRIAHIPHELGSKVPLLVFIHGVGGQVTKCMKSL